MELPWYRQAKVTPTTRDAVWSAVTVKEEDISMYTNVQLKLAIAAAEAQEMRVMIPYKMMLCVAITRQTK